MEIIENEFVKTWIEDGILHIVFLAETYDKQMIEFLIQTKQTLTKGQNYPMLSDTTRMKHMTREARERSSHEDVGRNLTAVAMLIRSKFQIVLFNFYNKIYKAPNPTKLFHYTKRDEAIRWLKEFEAQVK